MALKISNDLSRAKNIGKTTGARLNEIGVFSLADLAEMTSVEAFKRIRENYPDKTIPVCYYIYSLEGALLDLHWDDLPSDLKEELRLRVESAERR